MYMYFADCRTKRRESSFYHRITQNKGRIQAVLFHKTLATKKSARVKHQFLTGFRNFFTFMKSVWT